jgi:hypothetical protein
VASMTLARSKRFDFITVLHVIRGRGVKCLYPITRERLPNGARRRH